jgi:hypothetical protein
MSPEQAEGKPVGARSDVFSLGAVLYEMLTGRRAFQRESNLATLSAIRSDTPPLVGQLQSDVPETLERIVGRCLEKEPQSRYSSAELWQELSRLESQLAQEVRFRAILRKPKVTIPALALLATLAGTMGWFTIRNARARWARTVGLPEIARLIDERRNCAAFDLIRRVERYLPDDPELARLRKSSSARLSVRTNPPGADVYVRDYLDVADGARWFHAGRTPLDSAVIPAGVVPYRITKQGFETVEGTKVGGDVGALLEITLNAGGSTPPGMVQVPAQRANPANLVLVHPDRYLTLKEFWLDKTEVTNVQFQEFIRHDGYKERVLEVSVRTRGQSDFLGRSHGGFSGFDGAARPCHLARRNIRKGPGQLSRERGKLVRGCRLRGICR